MTKYKSFAKEKYIYFTLSIVAYFLPFIIVTACLMPIVREGHGLKIAMGMGVVLINAIPFLMGVFKSFFVHFPMLNILAIVFLFLAAFFTLDIFKHCVDTFLWIEFAAAAGSILSCIFWGKYKKYSQYRASLKAVIKSGAFIMKED